MVAIHRFVKDGLPDVAKAADRFRISPDIPDNELRHAMKETSP